MKWCRKESPLMTHSGHWHGNPDHRTRVVDSFLIGSTPLAALRGEDVLIRWTLVG
jgi:hypothetical protein